VLLAPVTLSEVSSLICSINELRVCLSFK